MNQLLTWRVSNASWSVSAVFWGVLWEKRSVLWATAGVGKNVDANWQSMGWKTVWGSEKPAQPKQSQSPSLSPLRAAWTYQAGPSPLPHPPPLLAVNLIQAGVGHGGGWGVGLLQQCSAPSRVLRTAPVSQVCCFNSSRVLLLLFSENPWDRLRLS